MSTEIAGFVEDGLGGVADAFRSNFDEGLEVGASLAVYREGRPLLDIWAGTADRRNGAPWQQNTVQTIFSGTKGMTGICMLLLLDRGLIQLDDPVRKHWPEFGKPHVRIREIVSHTARLPGIATAEITPEQFVDDRHMGAIMAREPQSSDLRAVLTYHSVTIGWLCGEVVRRVTGKSLSDFFAEEVAGPLGMEFWIGLPKAIEPRVAYLELNDTWTSGKVFQEVPEVDYKQDVLFWSQWWNPPHLSPGTFSHWNSRLFRAGRVPAANGVGTARSIAKAYGEIANDGGRLISADTLALASTPLCDGWDAVLEGPRKNSVVFQLNTANRHLGPVEKAFGHDGAGGSLHGAWPEQKIGFSYCMNLLRSDPAGEQRTPRIMDALARALGVL